MIIERTLGRFYASPDGIDWRGLPRTIKHYASACRYVGADPRPVLDLRGYYARKRAEFHILGARP